MIGRWTEWKRFPKAERGEHVEAPIGPGIYEVREAATGALFTFGAADSVAQALAALAMPPRSFTSWFRANGLANTPNLEYRTCATSTKTEAKTAAEGMVNRRETWLRGAA
jgi:hypothetical protein